MKIPYSKPLIPPQSIERIVQAAKNEKISGDGPCTKAVGMWFREHYSSPNSLLTPSCTASLELASMVLDIQPGDEVIMPSYTFVSTANAFVLRGAKIKFIDVREEDLNLDPSCIEAAITKRTKAIVPVHYAGVSCDMDVVQSLSRLYKIPIVEDAAQSIAAKYKNKFLGTLGEMGCISFHDTKNITSGGEGGLLIVNEEKYINRARILREKGTNRHDFLTGKIDKYSWVDMGSSYLASDMQAAFLMGALENLDSVIAERVEIWNRYRLNLKDLHKYRFLEIPAWSTHNGHIFYILVENKDKRAALLMYLSERGVQAVTHYVPLHSSLAGKRFGEFVGADVNTTNISERIIRLPIWNGLGHADIDKICQLVSDFHNEKNN